MDIRARLDGVRESLRGVMDTLRDAASSVRDGSNEADGFLSGPIMRLGLPISVFVVGGYAFLRLGPPGLITPDRVIYAVVFVCSALLIPGIIALNGPALSKVKLDGVLGKVNWTLGMLTFGIGILVQRENGNYEMWPARSQDGQLECYLDGEWKRLGRTEHLSRLGWRPFGIHFEKSTKRLKPYLEAFDGTDIVSDGGLRDARAGIDEQGPRNPARRDWVVDAVRLIPRKSAAGAALINRAEIKEIAEQNKGGRLASWSNVIGAVMGLVIGGIMAYIIFSP